MVKCSIGNRVGISLNLLFAKKSNKLTQIPKKQKAGQINDGCVYLYRLVQIIVWLFVPAHCRAAFNVATVYWTGSLSSLVTSGALLTLHRRDAA